MLYIQGIIVLVLCVIQSWSYQKSLFIVKFKISAVMFRWQHILVYFIHCCYMVSDSGVIPDSISKSFYYKEAIRIISDDRDSCRTSFSKLWIMRFPSLYVYSNLIYVKKNLLQHVNHSSRHNYNIRNRQDLVTPARFW